MAAPFSQTPIPTTGVGSASTTTLRVRRRWWLTVLLSFFFLCSSLVMAFHGYIAWTLARPHIDPLHTNPLLAIDIPYENVTFPSRSGHTKLQGWYLPGDSENTVIFSHGYGGNREEFWVPIYPLAKMLHDAGYNVLMFDYGYVQGGERIVTGGIQESQELLGAVDYIKAKGAHNVFIWGFSMGAGTALQAALKTSETKITAMILDSTFLLNPDTLYYNMRQVVDLPRYPSLSLIRWFFPLLNGVSLKQVPYSKVESKQYPMPIFFIHGKQDERAPYQTVEQLYKKQALQPDTKLWMLPNAKHELLYRAAPDIYKQRTMKFLQDHTISWSSFSGGR